MLGRLLRIPRAAITVAGGLRGALLNGFDTEGVSLPPLQIAIEPSGACRSIRPSHL